MFLATTTVTKIKIYSYNNHNILNKKANETVKQKETTTTTKKKIHTEMKEDSNKKKNKTCTLYT